jgi:hypothetical protein
MNGEKIWISLDELKTMEDFEYNFPELLLYKKGIYCCAELNPVTNRKSWQCPKCGNQFHPSAGTIFHKSSLLYTWWWIIIIELLENRNKPLGEIYSQWLEEGVSYPTAHRMYHLVKSRIEYDKINVSMAAPYIKTKRKYIRVYTEDKLISELKASEIF